MTPYKDKKKTMTLPASCPKAVKTVKTSYHRADQLISVNNHYLEKGEIEK